MAIEKEILDRLLADYKNPEDLTGENGVLRQLTKALMERALEAEMATHLGYEKHEPAPTPNGNRRNKLTLTQIEQSSSRVEIGVALGLL